MDVDDLLRLTQILYKNQEHHVDSIAWASAAEELSGAAQRTISADRCRDAFLAYAKPPSTTLSQALYRHLAQALLRERGESIIRQLRDLDRTQRRVIEEINQISAADEQSRRTQKAKTGEQAWDSLAGEQAGELHPGDSLAAQESFESYEEQPTMGPSGTVPQDTVPQDTVPQDTVRQDTVRQDTQPQDTQPQDTQPQDTVSQGTEIHDTEPQDTEPQDTVPHDALPHDTEPHTAPSPGPQVSTGTPSVSPETPSPPPQRHVRMSTRTRRRTSKTRENDASDAQTPSSAQDTPASPAETHEEPGTPADTPAESTDTEQPRATRRSKRTRDVPAEDVPEDEPLRRKSRRRANDDAEGDTRRSKEKEGGDESEPRRSTRNKEKEETDESEPSRRAAQDDGDERQLKKKTPVLFLLSQLQADPSSAPFRDAVRPADAPSYYEAIRQPMDLRELTRRVRAANTVSLADVKRDLLLICANAVQFNADEDSEEHADAVRMAAVAERMLRELQDN